jgi:hypothetical protein
MSRWFRHYAGLVRDEKLVRVALKAKQPIERVVWIWGAILESAAEINDGGRFEFDCEEAAHFLHVSETDCNVTVTELETQGRVSCNIVCNWNDRQFVSDSSTERVRRHRQIKKNQSDHIDNTFVTERSCNGNETLRNAPETETETEKKRNSPNRVRTAYDERFEEQFWKPYPRTPVMSKKLAQSEWLKLSDEDREDACLAVPRYAAWLRTKPDHPAVHACRFLSQRRFEGFKPQGQTGVTQEQIDWEREVMAYHGGSHWAFRRLGPEPMQGAICKAPREILEKYGYIPRASSSAA